MKIARTSGLAAILLAITTGAHADIFEFTESVDEDFSNALNWINLDDDNSNGVPGATDRIVIPSSKTCSIPNNPNVNSGDPDYTIDTMEVAGDLILEEDVRLELQNDDSNCGESGPGASCPLYDHSCIFSTGEVRLQDDSALFFTTEDHIISGEAGSDGIVTHDSSHFEYDIEIADGITLTNRLGSGQMIIDDTEGFILGDTEFEGIGSSALGSFVNEGIVKAIGDIYYRDTVQIEDTSGGRWAFKCHASMTFQRNALDLEGDFIGSCGSTIVCEAAVKTCGTWHRHSSWLSFPIAQASHYFAYADIEDDDQCGNPCTTCPSAPDCEEPFIADEDVGSAECFCVCV